MQGTRGRFGDEPVSAPGRLMDDRGEAWRETPYKLATKALPQLAALLFAAGRRWRQAAASRWEAEHAADEEGRARWRKMERAHRANAWQSAVELIDLTCELLAVSLGLDAMSHDDVGADLSEEALMILQRLHARGVAREHRKEARSWRR